MSLPHQRKPYYSHPTSDNGNRELAVKDNKLDNAEVDGDRQDIL